MKTGLPKSPWLELCLMLAAVLLSHVGLAIISALAESPAPGEMGTNVIALWLTGLFLISFAIAIVGVIAGIGGGVIFTPVMLAFTPVNSLVIRAAGLIVAMFSGLMASSLFLKKGLGHFKLCLVLVPSQGIGALVGAQLAIATATAFGAFGEGVIRIVLGVILSGIAVYFFIGGRKMEWPNITSVDALTRWMRLEHSYREESDGRVYSYRITRILAGVLLVSLVGFMGGFFGMGAGWTLTPVQNLVLGVPLKAAVANSRIIISIVDSIAIWPYLPCRGNPSASCSPAAFRAGSGRTAWRDSYGQGQDNDCARHPNRHNVFYKFRACIRRTCDFGHYGKGSRRNFADGVHPRHGREPVRGF